MARRLRVALSVGFLVGLVLAAPALGAFPGANGKIAFQQRTSDFADPTVQTINPDGTGQAALVNTLSGGPAWSPDGKSVAYISFDLWIINADGSNNHVVRGTNEGSSPSWSPDGTRIAFGDEFCTSDPPNCDFVVDVTNADGTGPLQEFAQDAT